jgi:hypothetical protein
MPVSSLDRGEARIVGRVLPPVKRDRAKRPSVNEAPVTASKGICVLWFEKDSERKSTVWLYRAMVALRVTPGTTDLGQAVVASFSSDRKLLIEENETKE